MFFGEYKHSLDEKNRLRVPAKLKKSLGKKYIFTKGTNGCLFIFAEENFEEQILSKLKNVSLFDTKASTPVRLLMSSAYEAEQDNQGRILLPKALREFAGIKKDIMFIGVGNHIELWNNKAWKKYLEDQKQDFDEILGGLKDYGI